MASSPQKSPSSPKSPTPKSPPSRKKDDSFLGKLGGTLARRKKAKEGKNRGSARFLGVTSGRGGGWEETRGEERLGGAEEGADGRTRVGWGGEASGEGRSALSPRGAVRGGSAGRETAGCCGRGAGPGWAVRIGRESAGGAEFVPRAGEGRRAGRRSGPYPRGGPGAVRMAGGAEPAALRACEAAVRGVGDLVRVWLAGPLGSAGARPAVGTALWESRVTHTAGSCAPRLTV